MTLEQSILNAVRVLPVEKQQEILRIAESFREDSQAKQPLKSGRGIWANLGFSLSAEDVDEARQEMWGNFPRSDV